MPRAKTNSTSGHWAEAAGVPVTSTVVTAAAAVIAVVRRRAGAASALIISPYSHIPVPGSNRGLRVGPPV